nr:hypothetical protein PI49.0310 [Phytophthora infestans]
MELKKKTGEGWKSHKSAEWSIYQDTSPIAPFKRRCTAPRYWRIVVPRESGEYKDRQSVVETKTVTNVSQAASCRGIQHSLPEVNAHTNQAIKRTSLQNAMSAHNCTTVV